MEGALRRTLNLAQPDDVYNAIVDAHKGLSDEQCRAFDARLILLLVNHIGDEAVIREALRGGGGRGMKDLLTGRLALVTGGGRGNGAAIARGLAQWGARVIVTDIDTEAAHVTAETIVEAGGEARGYALDVTDRDGCRKLAEDIELLVGPIRILVNNAGIFLRGNLLAADGRERWDMTMAVNVDGVFNVTTAFADQLKRTRGTIVNIASVNSFTAPAGSGVYPGPKGRLPSSRGRWPPSWRPTACASTPSRPASSPPP